MIDVVGRSVAGYVDYVHTHPNLDEYKSGMHCIVDQVFQNRDRLLTHVARFIPCRLIHRFHLV